MGQFNIVFLIVFRLIHWHFQLFYATLTHYQASMFDYQMLVLTKTACSAKNGAPSR